MALFFELGIFGLALAFGVWQLRDVAKAREETAAKRLAEQAKPPQAASKDAGSGTAN